MKTSFYVICIGGTVIYGHLVVQGCKLLAMLVVAALTAVGLIYSLLTYKRQRQARTAERDAATVEAITGQEKFKSNNLQLEVYVKEGVVEGLYLSAYSSVLGALVEPLAYLF